MNKTELLSSKPLLDRLRKTAAYLNQFPEIAEGVAEIERLRAALQRAYMELDDILEDWQLDGRHGQPRYEQLLRERDAVREAFGVPQVETIAGTSPVACRHPVGNYHCPTCGIEITTSPVKPPKCERCGDYFVATEYGWTHSCATGPQLGNL